MTAFWFPGREVPEDDEGFYRLVAEINYIQEYYRDVMASAIGKALSGD